MVTRKKPSLEWNEQNKNIVICLITKHLTTDLLPKKFLKKNESNPMYGHCHTASGCFYKIFGSKNVHMYRGLDKIGLYHWWIQDKDGVIIDITESQYPRTEVEKIYRTGEKKPMLGFDYRKRVDELLNRVITDLGIQDEN
jgi:hypothetical protein